MGKATVRRALQALAAIVIAALAIGLYKAKSDASRTEAHVRQLQSEIAEGEASLRALRAEIAELERPERIETLAERRLGAVVGSESAALPETAIDQRLPAAKAPPAPE
jgi:cell division protein FtsL